MARGVNKVILIGNLGAEPELRYTPSQRAVVNLRLATSRSWTDRQSNERREETEWHRVVLFGRQAEVANEYLKKGSQAYIEGRVQTRKWQDQSGQDRYTTEIIGEDLQLLGSRPNGAAAGGSRNQDLPAGLQQGGPPPRGDDDFNDDIPF